MVSKKAQLQIEEKMDGLTSPGKRHVDTVTATTERQKDQDWTVSGKSRNYWGLSFFSPQNKNVLALFLNKSDFTLL